MYSVRARRQGATPCSRRRRRTSSRSPSTRDGRHLRRQRSRGPRLPARRAGPCLRAARLALPRDPGPRAGGGRPSSTWPPSTAARPRRRPARPRRRRGQRSAPVTAEVTVTESFSVVPPGAAAPVAGDASGAEAAAGDGAAEGRRAAICAPTATSTRSGPRPRTCRTRWPCNGSAVLVGTGDKGKVYRVARRPASGRSSRRCPPSR